MSPNQSSHNFRQDPSGLWHHISRDLGHVDSAIAEAIEHLDGRVAWFWWGDTFAPILPNDNTESLHQRWSTWRRRFQDDNRSTLTDLYIFATTGD
jgi:hypothetical protein